MWGRSGNAQLDSLELPDAYFNRIAVLRDLVEVYKREIGFLDRDIHLMLRDDAGYDAIQAIYGVGPVLAAVFVAEIGDVTRFDSPKALSSWAGLTPKHRESDTHVHRGRITKQGSRMVRWAAIEAVARYHGGAVFRDRFAAIAERRGTKKANVAIARTVLTLVYYGLRDGEIRRLADHEVAA
jgi:transposase